MLEGVVQAVLVYVVGNVVCGGLYLGPAVAHGHVVGAQLKHGEVDLCVAERDGVGLVGTQVLQQNLNGVLLGNALGTKVSIKPKDNSKGKIEIEYYTSNEFERIAELLVKAANQV